MTSLSESTAHPIPDSNSLVTRPTVAEKSSSYFMWNHLLSTKLTVFSFLLLVATSFLLFTSWSFGLSGAFVRLRVMRSWALSVVAQVVGWVYFAAWSVSFYPQVILNWRRKSVYGLNFDFLALNLTGFICYSIYNCALFWPTPAQTGYFTANPRGSNPVQVQDVTFALHAVAITAFTIAQCFFYERGNQRVSRTCWAIVACLWGIFGLLLILTLSGVRTWFQFVSYVSYIKIFVTVIKYIPQAYQNFRRKSTVGWSIGNVLLDFTGGTMSIAQMFMLSYNFDDWEEVFLDPTKFWLGALSIIFDTLFIVQHYILYRQRESESYKPMEEEEEGGVGDSGDEGDNGALRDAAADHSGDYGISARDEDI